MADDNDHKVGYGHPPLHTRFVKGHSGNPKGRPKGKKKLLTVASEIGQQKVRVNTENGVRYITKQEAVVMQLANIAMSGKNRAAMRDFLQLQRVCDEMADTNGSVPEISQSDAAVMKNLLKRIREAKDEPEHIENSCSGEQIE